MRRSTRVWKGDDMGRSHRRTLARRRRRVVRRRVRAKEVGPGPLFLFEDKLW